MKTAFIVGIALGGVFGLGCASDRGARPLDTQSLSEPVPVITFNVARTSRVQTPQPFFQKIMTGTHVAVAADGTKKSAANLKVEPVERIPSFGQYLVIDVDFHASGGRSNAVMLAGACHLTNGQSAEKLFIWGELEGTTAWAGTRSADGPAIAGFEIPVGTTVRKRFIADYAPASESGVQLTCSDAGNINLVP